MNNREIMLMSISLLNAINENDLTTTKILVQDLNDNFQPSPNMQNLNQLISFSDIIENKNFEINESFDYAINNLCNISNIDEIKWLITVLELLKNKNIIEIENFILQSLEKNIIRDYEIQSLIQLCVTIDRYDLLNQLKDKISL